MELPNKRGSARQIVLRLLPAAIGLPIALDFVRLVGERAGYYSHDTGTWLMTVALVVAFSALVWGSAREVERVETALRESEARVRALVEGSPLAMVVIDVTGRVQLCNAAFERLFGYPNDEIAGKLIDQYVADPEDPEGSYELSRRAFARESTHTTTRRRRRDGRLVDVELFVVPLVVEGTLVGAYAVYRDLTEERRAERRLGIQHEVTRVLAEAGSVGGSAGELLAVLTPLVGADIGAFWRNDAGILHCAAVWSPPAMEAEGFETLLRETILDAPSALPARVFASSELEWVADLPRDRRDERAGPARVAGLHTAFAAPIVLGADVLGVLEFFCRELRTADDDLLEALGGAGRQIGVHAGRQAAELALREKAEEVHLLLESAAEAIFGVDAEGRCTFCNPSCLRLLGYSRPEELVGRRMHEVMHAKRDSGLPYPLDECAICHTHRTGRQVHVDAETLWRLDGTSFPAEYWAYPIRRDGRLAGAVVTFLDVTARSAAARQMHEALKMKSDFVTFVTHQLRTPLSGILWMLELAAGTEDREERDSYIRDARSAADRLLRLVSDLLAVAPLESGKLQVRLEPVDLEELTRSVLADVATLVREKGHRLDVQAAASRPVLVDAQLVRQVVLNLVSNAIRYTPAGGRIDVRIEDEQGEVCWAIRDTGIGVPQEAQSHLFQKFFRADNAKTVDTEGTGLGLYLSRLIVERFGGRLACESEPAQGATFWFRLPGHERPVRPAPPPRPAAGRADRGAEGR